VGRNQYETDSSLVTDSADDPLDVARFVEAGRWAGPGPGPADRQIRRRDQTDQIPGSTWSGRADSDVNAAAVAAYCASVRTGEPLSERKLASMFGKTSRRWARNRMAEARQSPSPAPA